MPTAHVSIDCDALGGWHSQGGARPTLSSCDKLSFTEQAAPERLLAGATLRVPDTRGAVKRSAGEEVAALVEGHATHPGAMPCNPHQAPYTLPAI